MTIHSRPTEMYIFFFHVNWKKMLGSGTYGAVFKATHKVTKDPRAIKAIAKAKVKNPESFKNEIEIMKKLVCVAISYTNV